MKRSSSFIGKQLEKLVDKNMVSDVITLDLNKLPDKEDFEEENA